MSSNTPEISSEKKATLSLGRLYTFLIALFMIVAEIVYYGIFSNGANHLRMDSMFFHKFLIEPFSFLSTWMGQVNFYSISISALGVIIAFLVILLIALSNMVKNNLGKTILQIAGVIFAVLYVVLMFTGIIQTYIGMIFIFAAIILLAFDFPFKKIAVISLVIIAWVFSVIMGIINPYLESSNIITTYRQNQNPAATIILKYDTDVSGVLHITDAKKTEIIDGIELYVYQRKDDTLQQILNDLVQSIENNAEKSIEEVIEESNQKNIATFKEDLVIDRKDVDTIVTYFYAYYNENSKAQIINFMLENNYSDTLSKYYEDYFRRLMTQYSQNQLSILQDKVSFIPDNFENKVQQMVNIGEIFNDFSIEEYIENGLNLEDYSNYISPEFMRSLIPEDILPIVMKQLNTRVNNVLAASIKPELEKEYGISRLEFRSTPVDFKPISIEFTEHSDEQVLSVKELKPYTKYWYYIDSYDKEYPEGKLITETLNIIRKYPIVLTYKQEQYKERLIEIITGLGGESNNIENSLNELNKNNNLSYNDAINFLNDFGVDDIPNRTGLVFTTNTQSFYTPTKSLKDEREPFIADADQYIEPLDIDFSDFIKDNYDRIVNDIRDASPIEKGQYAIYLGEIWGIPEGSNRNEIEKSSKFYELLGQNAERLISIIPNRESVNKETSDRFMAEIRSIISSQTTNPNLAEDLKIPAKVRLVVRFDEKAVGDLSVTINKNKDPLKALSQRDLSYTWEAEFSLMDYQYQGVEVGSALDIFDKGRFKKPDPNRPGNEIVDWDAYIKEYRDAPVEFNMEAYRQSDLTMFLNRKYSYSVKPIDERGNEGNFSQHEASGIQTNVTTADSTNIINIIVSIGILILLLVYSFFSIMNMKKKFMIRESLPIFLANMGIIILIINLVSSIIIGLFPIKLEFFILISMIFFILSKQMWAIRLSIGLAGGLIIISLISIFVNVVPELLISFRPPVDPNVPASFVEMMPSTLIVPIFIYILSFAICSNMLINNLGTKRNVVMGWVAIIALFIVTVVTAILALNIYSSGKEAEILRNIALICGSGFIGTLIGVSIVGNWGKALGQIMFPLLLVGYVIFIIMGFVPFKLPLMLILIAYLIIGTPWARSATIAYFFIQSFVLIFTFIILLSEMEYDLILKLVLLAIGLIYFVMAIFTIKSKRVKDYSEGKL